ncbi:MarR family winged helix-turn-helix transcriptional regulator [Streptomyces sp. 796.1]|uniref:MarR family winged helix-turn-helix transcriptional regulator n=1 Tax=Streptomyces sp. 796.1 TaxID=3163029 RepID=UPI0039C930DA
MARPEDTNQQADDALAADATPAAGSTSAADAASTAHSTPPADAAPAPDATPVARDTPAADDAPHPGDATTEAATRAWQGLHTLLLDRHNRRKEVADALGMSFSRIRALRRIAPGPLTLRELAARLASDPPYTTVIVDDLVRRGLAERLTHPVDRRAKLVRLTEAGHTAATRATAILATPPDALLALPTEDIEALDRVVTKLLK